MTVPKTLICKVCGGGVQPKEFRSMAFPLSKPFWRAVCENCGWFGGVAETADAAMTRVERYLNKTEQKEN